MPGKPVSRTLWLLIGVLPAVCACFPTAAAADPTPPAGILQYQTQQDTVVQLVAEPNRWLGFRQPTILRSNFPGPSGSPYYRAFVADRNIYSFSSLVSAGMGAFSTAADFYDPEAGDAYVCHVSNVLVGNNYETMVWTVTPAGLLTVSATQPSSLSRRGSVPLPVLPEDVVTSYYIVGGVDYYMVYTVNGEHGVKIYSIDATVSWSSAQLSHRGSIETPGDAVCAVFQDSLLFVADGVGGLRVIDVWDADDPSLFFEGATGGPAKSVSLSGDLVLVSEWDHGVELWKVEPYSFNIEDFESYPSQPADSLRAYWHVERPPTILLETFEDYVTDEELRAQWVVAGADTDSVSIVASDYEGSQAVRLDYNLVDARESWIRFALEEQQDWTGYHRLMMGILGDRNSARADLQVKVITADEDTLVGARVANATIGTRWQPYSLVLSDLRPRSRVTEIHLGVLPQSPPAASTTGQIFFDLLQVPVADSLTIISPGQEGAQGMRLVYNLVDTTASWVRYSFAEEQDWTNISHLAVPFRGDRRAPNADLAVRVTTAEGDTLTGPRFLAAAQVEEWRGYTLDVTSLEPRDRVTDMYIGVLPSETQPASAARWIDFDHVFIRTLAGDINLIYTIDTPGFAHQAVAQDSLIYVADWDGGLRVYDFTRFMDSDVRLVDAFGEGGEYLSVSVSDSVILAGNHSALQILRLGADRTPPAIVSGVTQTPYLRSYLRTYVLASETLPEMPTVNHLTLSRQATVEDFENYQATDSLRAYWTVGAASDSVTAVTTPYEGAQAMEFHFHLLPSESAASVRTMFVENQDWSLYDRLTLYYRGGESADTASLYVRVYAASGDSLTGATATRATVAPDWQAYSLDLSAFDARDEISRIRVRVVRAAVGDTTSGSILIDHLLLRRVAVEVTKDGPPDLPEPSVVPVEMSQVSGAPNLYTGDFQLVAADTGMTNAIVVMATDRSGNTSTTRTEYRSQLVVPSEGTLLRSPDERLSVLVPPGATSMESFFFVIPKSWGLEIALPGGETDMFEALPEGASLIGRPYEVGLAGPSLRGEVELAFQLDGSRLAGLDPTELGVYRHEGGRWVYLGGSYDPGTKQVRLHSSKLGLVALMANPNTPLLARDGRITLTAYPNPFNPNTMISYACPARAHVSLKIYDVEGRLVKTLVDDPSHEAGVHFAAWGGRTDARKAVTSGIYFARLQVGQDTRSIKLVLIR